MDDKKEPEKEPVTDKGSQSIVHKALTVMENTETIAGSHRQLVNGALIGACLLFIAALLGVQKIDTPLNFALVAFAVTIPLLVYGFLYSNYKAKPAPGYLVLVALELGAWVIEALGYIAVAVGVFAVVAHLSPLAFNAMIITSILVVVLGFIGSFIGLMVYGWRQVKKQGGKQDKNPPAASGDTPLQTQ